MSISKFSHDLIERHVGLLLVMVILVVSVGGLVEIVPLFFQKSTTEAVTGLKPYTALQLTGRDIYLKEGCYGCHSQMIRPFRAETERYGHYSVAGESVYDHPFQWGSKRTGPDLARIGGKYPNSWHYNHMWDPRSMSPGSIMPNYPWLFDNKIDTSLTGAKIRAMISLGVPYPKGYDKIANQDLFEQAKGIKENLKKDKIETPGSAEIVALIAYLQRVGTDIKAAPKQMAALK